MVPVGSGLMDTAFGHHAWATLALIDTCAALGEEQLEATAEGVYGTIIDTLRHLVQADSNYLVALSGGAVPAVKLGGHDLAGLREVMQSNAAAWTEYLAGDLQADAVVGRRREDGSSTEATVGVRLAQALHHGTDHRSQICTILTRLGVEPPDIDVWVYGELEGRVVEHPPTAE